MPDPKDGFTVPGVLEVGAKGFVKGIGTLVTWGIIGTKAIAKGAVAGGTETIAEVKRVVKK